MGGAADRFQFALGNALVGNPPDTPALEITLQGPTLQSDVPLACVVQGAPFDLFTSSRALRAGTTFTLPAGETLTIGGSGEGMRGYLCIHGGVQIASILGSQSSLEPLRAGEELACHPATIGGRFLGPSFTSQDDPLLLRVLPGPQVDWFEREAFLANSYTVSPSSNRMGLRLQGNPLRVPSRELISEPVCPGSVQVTREGQCIILGIDAQTIGGYPRIVQVISADLDKLGRLRPGEVVRFRLVTLAEAEALYHARQNELHNWCQRARVTALVRRLSEE